MHIFFSEKKGTAAIILTLTVASGLLLYLSGCDAVYADKSSETGIIIEGTVDYDFADDILALVNKERKSAGLNKLTMSEAEVVSAGIRARECILKYSHRRPVSADWTSLMSSGYSHVGENLAIGYDSAETVVSAWMNSAEHRANILASDYVSIGISVFRYDHPITGKTTYAIAQHFSNLSGGGSDKTGKVTDTFEINVDLDRYPLKFKLEINEADKNGTVILHEGGELTPVVKVTASEIWGQNDIAVQAGTFKWTADDSKIVEITESGSIKAVGIGSTLVQAEAPDDEFTSIFQLVVKEHIDSAEISHPQSFKYTGSEIEPDLELDIGDTGLIEGKDYKITYSDNIYVGTGHIHITGMGDYCGEVVVHFSIYDDSTVIKKSFFRKILDFLGFD